MASSIADLRSILIFLYIPNKSICGEQFAAESFEIQCLKEFVEKRFPSENFYWKFWEKSYLTQKFRSTKFEGDRQSSLSLHHKLYNSLNWRSHSWTSKSASVCLFSVCKTLLNRRYPRFCGGGTKRRIVIQYYRIMRFEIWISNPTWIAYWTLSGAFSLQCNCSQNKKKGFAGSKRWYNVVTWRPKFAILKHRMPVHLVRSSD